MNRKVMIMILIVSLLLSLNGCGIHIHKWEDATCTAPKTCSGCGETQGEKIRHNVPEDGVCTICKQKKDNVLTLEKKSRPIPPVVYGGAKLLIIATGTENGIMFPGTYTIYAEDGTSVAEGDWGNVDNLWFSGAVPEAEYCYTDYIAMEPGSYRVEFSYYKNYEYDDKNTKQFIPAGDAYWVTYVFIVR